MWHILRTARLSNNGLALHNLSSHSSVERKCTQCLGGHEFNPCRQLRSLLCLICWLLHSSHFNYQALNSPFLFIIKVVAIVYKLQKYKIKFKNKKNSNKVLTYIHSFEACILELKKNKEFLTKDSTRICYKPEASHRGLLICHIPSEVCKLYKCLVRCPGLFPRLSDNTRTEN